MELSKKQAELEMKLKNERVAKQAEIQKMALIQKEKSSSEDS